MPDFSIGVDLGGTNLRIAAVTAEGELLEKVTLGSRGAPTPHHVIDQMCNAIQGLTGKYKRSGKFLGTGIGIPGIIDLQAGMVRASANLPGWKDYPVRAEIDRRLGLQESGTRIVLDNDANVAALGEQWLGAGRGVENMAVVTLGTGIGGGIVLGGKIWHGMHGMAGEFGHVTLEPEGPLCGCGNRGCAESYASASAILRMAREAIASGDAPSLASASADPEFGAQSIYNLALQGDPHARRIFQTMGRYLGILLAGMINVLDLEVFVIGGGVSSAWDAYSPSMFAELRARSTVYASTASKAKEDADSRGRTTIITRALLGGDAGLYGAARAAVLAG
jgi:glucokinase